MNKAEEKFAEWLDSWRIPYWFIEQGMDTKSWVLSCEGVKRPDFLLFIRHVGFILVDVKGYGPHSDYDNFTLNYREVGGYADFGREYKLSIWFAISYKGVRFQTWYWMPVEEVFDEGELVRPSDDEGDWFWSVPMKSFRQVGVKDRIGKLLV